MKERKLRFNFIDLLILLVIAAGIFAVLYIFVFSGRGKSTVVDTQYTKIRYIVQFQSVDEEFADSVVAGDLVEEPVERRTIGTVVAVQSEPCQKIIFNYDEAKETVATYDGKVTMYITVEADAVETDSAFTVDGLPIRVGTQYSLSMPNMYGNGYCIELYPVSDN